MDLHSEIILEEYKANLPAYERLRDIVVPMLEDAIRECGMEVTSVGARIKTEQSLAGKLALKGSKYASLSDITDILGARIITFYTDDVDRIASMASSIRAEARKLKADATAALEAAKRKIEARIVK